MHIPDALAPLFDNGMIERVVRPLMSGKEAQVFLVVSQGELRVAKVYKEAHNRTFKNRAEYTEGRKTRNSRDQRAIEKRSKHGRAQDEAAWKSTEVDMIHRLHAGGVRVPTPHAFMDGVLVMECVVDPEGNPAPRLGDISFEPEAAQAMYDRVIREVVRMLAVGVVHGDLSDFNVLASGDEPVIIDFPQSVDTASNTNARRLLLRDVDNLYRFLSKYVPKAPRLPYAEEMWELHESNALTADTRLTGRYKPTQRRTSDDSVLDLIQDADRDERERRDRLGLRGGPRPAPAPAAVYQSPFPPGHQPRGLKQSPQSRGPRPAPAVYQSPFPPGHQPRGLNQRGPNQPQQSRGPQPNQPQQSRGPQPNQPQQSRGPQPPRGPHPAQHDRGPNPPRGPQNPQQGRGGQQPQQSRGPNQPAHQPQQSRGQQPQQSRGQQPYQPRPQTGRDHSPPQAPGPRPADEPQRADAPRSRGTTTSR